MRRAKAFVFAAEEDFGISVVEAQACGTPVIAYGKGGALETVLDSLHARPTGLFFDEQTTAAIIEAVEGFELGAVKIDPADCRANAERFSIRHFRDGLRAYVQSVALQFTLAPPAMPPVPVIEPVSTAAASQLDQDHEEADAMRVLAVDQSGVLGGAELSLLEVMKNMRGNNETVLFDDGPFRIALEAVGLKIDVLDGAALGGLSKDGGMKRPGVGMIGGVMSLVRGTLEKSRNSDVIYVNTQRAMVVGAIAGLISRRPVV